MKEFQRSIDSLLLRGAMWRLELGKKHTVKPEGQPGLNALLEKFKNGQRVLPHEHPDTLKGYPILTEGLDHLQELQDKKFLVVFNHFGEGPIAGFWQVIQISKNVKEQTCREITWLQKPELGFWQKVPVLKEAINRPVSRAHHLISESLESILIENGEGINGLRKIKEAIKSGKCIGISPEGEPSSELKRGDYRAGKIMSQAAKNGYFVICAANWCENGRLFLRFSKPIAPEKITRINSHDRNLDGQKITDGIMHEMASLLPLRFRGCYSTALPK